MADRSSREDHHSHSNEHDEEDDNSLYAGADDSPADGYFNQRPSAPQASYIQTSSVQAEAERKAREAAEEDARTRTTSLPPGMIPGDTAARPAPDAQQDPTPILDAGPAPPDYAAATADRSHRTVPGRRHQHSHHRTPSRPDSIPGYHEPESQDLSRRSSLASITSSQTSLLSNTTEQQWPFGNRGNPFGPGFPYNLRGGGGSASEAGPPSTIGAPQYHPRQEPVSMRGASDWPQSNHPELANETTPLRPSDETTKKNKTPRWRRCCASVPAANALLFALSISLLILLLAMLYSMGNHDDNHSGTQPTIPPGAGSPGDGKIPHNPKAYPLPSDCPYVSWTETVDVEFSHPANFSFVELMESQDAPYMSLHGLLIVEPADSSQVADIRIALGAATTNPWRVTGLNYLSDDDGMHLQMPDLEKTDAVESTQQCLAFGARIMVKRGINVPAWVFTTANMAVEVREGVFGSVDDHDEKNDRAVQPAESVEITALSRSIKAGYVSARETRIESTSSSIHGTYALRDLLWVHSRSGTISIDVDPRPEDEDAPAPAELTIISSAGSIKSNILTSDHVPERDYRTRVESNSGSISGSYMLGSRTTFDTTSSSVNIDVLPYSTECDDQTLRTTTSSGHTSVTVLSPYLDPGALDGLRSSHKTSSASIDLKYPQEWEGGAEGRTRSASITFSGKGLKVISDSDTGPVGRYVYARKGYGKSKLEARTNSGSIKLLVGDR